MAIVFLEGIHTGQCCAHINAYWQRHDIVDDSPVNLVPKGYEMGYKNAADYLVRNCMNLDVMCDNLVYPIVFLYRQYIELILKHYLRLFCDEEKFKNLIRWHRHDIKSLFSEVCKIKDVDSFRNKNNENCYELIKQVIREYHLYDRASFSFRYDFSTNLSETIPQQLTVNLLALYNFADDLEYAFCELEMY